MSFCIRTKESSMRNLKGKNVSEFQRNLTSIGWPTELPGDIHDKIRYMEKKLGRPLQRGEIGRNYK